MVDCVIPIQNDMYQMNHRKENERWLCGKSYDKVDDLLIREENSHEILGYLQYIQHLAKTNDIGCEGRSLAVKLHSFNLTE